MNKTKFLLPLLILCSCGSLSSSEDPYFINRKGYDFIFSIINNEIRIDEIKSNLKNSLKILNIPSYIDNIPVTSIESSAFSGASIEKINFLDDCNIEKIEKYAFSDCKKLLEVNIPSKVNYLGEGVFCDCTSLESVIFEGDNIDNIRSLTFFNNSKLKEITLPSSLISIGDETFMNCVELEKVHITSLIEEIGYYSFSNDTKVDVMFYEIVEIPTSFNEEWAYTEELHINGTNQITYSFI